MDIDITLILGSIIGFAIVIGVLVTVHEFGHFIAARLAGMRVEIFSIGMGKRLFGFNNINGFTFGELPDDWDGGDNTDYRVAILPIGGYVKVPGMIDESMDTEHVESEPKPWEFRAKGPWAKALFITAGVILNWFLAVTFFAYIAFVGGVETNPTTSVGYVVPGTAAEDAGLRTGDRIFTIRGDTVHNWDDIMEGLFFDDIGSDVDVQLYRKGVLRRLTLSGFRLAEFLKHPRRFTGLVNNRSATFVASVGSDRAKELGLQPGDTIAYLNTVKIFSYDQFRNYVVARPGETIEVTWKRGAEMHSGKVTIDETGKLGIGLGEEFNGIPREFTFAGSWSYGWNRSVSILTGFFNTITAIFTGKVSAGDSLGGPIEIAKQSGLRLLSGDFNGFLAFMASLSVVLALINILPIPALDGGHLVIIIVEGVMRRELPTKIKIYIQYAGLIFVLGLMILVLGLDISRWF